MLVADTQKSHLSVQASKQTNKTLGLHIYISYISSMRYVGLMFIINWPNV